MDLLLVKINENNLEDYKITLLSTLSETKKDKLTNIIITLFSFLDVSIDNVDDKGDATMLAITFEGSDISINMENFETDMDAEDLKLILDEIVNIMLDDNTEVE
jgi:predicted transcriptional regulator